MDLEKKEILKFDVDAGSIDIKQLLQKDFLELSMRVISNANPNVNNSWFTTESMEKGIKTFANKPILGYFENGDFVSHDGEWDYDEETDMDYWNTLGKKGERILGLIRESDEVKIVEGKDGLDWIQISCCLWTSYSFKQVKRLIKDAKKAQKNGGVAKNVSVEVEITDSELLPTGIRKINDFNLLGVTILGSRNGVKVEPGIENAGLSVVDVMGKDVFAKQEQAIRMAYAKLETPANKNKEKEEISEMDNELFNEVQLTAEEQNSATEVTTPASEETNVDANTLANPDQTFAEEDKKEEDKKEDETKEEDKEDCEEDKEKKEDECGGGKFEEENVASEEVENTENTEVTEVQSTEEEAQASTEEKFEESAEKPACPGCENMVLQDLAWLIPHLADYAVNIAYTLDYYRDMEGKEFIVNALERMKRQYAEDIELLGKCISEQAEELKDSLLKFEEEVKEETITSLNEKYNSVKAELEVAEGKLNEIAKKDFLFEADKMIKSAQIKDEDFVKQVYSECEDGTINNLDDLKVKVSLKMFEAFTANNQASVEVEEKHGEEQKEEKVEEESFSAPVSTPNPSAVFEKDDKKSTKKTSWDTIREMNSKQ